MKNHIVTFDDKIYVHYSSLKLFEYVPIPFCYYKTVAKPRGVVRFTFDPIGEIIMFLLMAKSIISKQNPVLNKCIFY